MLESTVRHYHVWGQLSAGGMGEVWLARHAELALPVVIKTLLNHDPATAEAEWLRLLAEARMSARSAADLRTGGGAFCCWRCQSPMTSRYPFF
jgi:serine/threonine protein kinase